MMRIGKKRKSSESSEERVAKIMIEEKKKITKILNIDEDNAMDIAFVNADINDINEINKIIDNEPLKWLTRALLFKKLVPCDIERENLIIACRDKRVNKELESQMDSLCQKFF